MRITFPHLGNVYVILKGAFRELGIETVVPPPSSKRSLSLGVRYSPETICLPFKITLGNMIEALEQGADTIVMAAGRGLCRFGYYARLQEQILHDLGYDFKMIPTDLFGGKIVGVARLIKRLSNRASMFRVIHALRFALSKLATLDNIEREVHRVRALELEKGTATRIFREAISATDEATDHASLKKAKADYLARLNQVPVDLEANPLKVGVMGEFYIVLEPFSNMDVEIELGKLGVEVKRSLFLSNWTKFSLFLNAFGMTEQGRFHRAAKPYLKRDVGGDGWESVGEKAFHGNHYDGLVHLAPFTCLPEIVAQNIMPSVKEDIPVLTLLYDEQMGKAGMLTRLEAFVDLLKRRRSKVAADSLAKVR